MPEASCSKAAQSVVLKSGATSGFTINLHPLPILNISEHHTRACLTNASSTKLIGALLGSEVNREVSISNSFELTFLNDTIDGRDVVMGEGTEAAARPPRLTLDQEFLETRREQYKQVFPTLAVVGWYTIGSQPSIDDANLHQQFATVMDTPVLVLFDPSLQPRAQELPISVYEAALVEGENESEAEGKFVPLEYGVETGEAERIAVDGVSRGGMGGEGDENAAGNLITQRNAIRMLYERIDVLSRYVTSVIEKSAPADQGILRQIAALATTLPTMDAEAFKAELVTESFDVQITQYMTVLAKQLDALSDYSDRHHLLNPERHDGLGGSAHGGRPSRPFGGGDFGGRRRRVGP